MSLILATDIMRGASLALAATCLAIYAWRWPDFVLAPPRRRLRMYREGLWVVVAAIGTGQSLLAHRPPLVATPLVLVALGISVWDLTRPCRERRRASRQSPPA